MKIGLGILGLLLAAFAVLGFTAPKSFKIERSITIHRNLEPVYKYILLLRKTPEWNAWLKKDPAAKIEFRGEDGLVGSTMSWTSDNPEVGTAEQEILNIAAWEIVHSEIRFQKPFEANFKSYLTVDGKGPEETLVAMGMTDKMGFPENVISFLMNIVFSQKKKVSADIDASLLNLKTIMESKK